MPLLTPQPQRRNPLLEALVDTVDPRPALSDAWWSVTHPRDRVMGRGRAAGGQMMFPTMRLNPSLGRPIPHQDTQALAIALQMEKQRALRAANPMGEIPRHLRVPGGRTASRYTERRRGGV